jgi:hypothetical protein
MVRDLTGFQQLLFSADSVISASTLASFDHREVATCNRLARPELRSQPQDRNPDAAMQHRRIRLIRQRKSQGQRALA